MSKFKNSVSNVLDAITEKMLESPKEIAIVIIAIIIGALCQFSGAIGFTIDMVIWAAFGILFAEKVLPSQPKHGQTGGTGGPKNNSHGGTGQTGGPPHQNQNQNQDNGFTSI